MLYAFKNITSFLKKAFIVIIVYVIVIGLFSNFISKDRLKTTTNLAEKNRSEIYAQLNNKKLNSTEQGRLQLALYRTMLCTTIGEACTNNPEDGNEYFNKSIFGFITTIISIPYTNPPASGIYWASSGLQNAGFIPNIYAAEGIGFSNIKPLMNIWKIFRDLSYLLLVIALIAIGFMIMFRVKLNPQTVIGVENSLPKIVVTLILITFSFAIAGFLIDLMYVSMSIIISIMGNNNNYYDIGEFQNKYLNANSFEIFNSIFAADSFGGGLQNLFALGSIFTNLFVIMPNVVTSTIQVIIHQLASFFITKTVFSFLIAWIGMAFSNIDVAAFSLGKLPRIITYPLILGVSITLGTVLAPLLIAAVVGILIFLTIVFLFLRIFFLLFTTYIKILFLVIFAPVFLLLNVIPGKNVFGYWLKSLMGELITFPLVLLLFLTGYLMVNQLAAPGDLWKAPFLAGLNPNALLVFLGMGIIFMIPNFVKTVKELLGLKPMPIAIGPAAFFSGASTGVGGAAGTLGQISSISFGLQALGLKSPNQGFMNIFKKGKGSEPPSKDEAQQTIQGVHGAPPQQ